MDCHGLVAVPGLIDAHVHWGNAAQARWAATPPTPDAMGGEYAAFLPAERLACLRQGVTAFLSLGDPVGWILAMRAAIRGGMPGPEVHAAGPLFTAPGGHPASDLFVGNGWLIAEACRQYGAGEAAAAAREVDALAALGVDAIKAVYDGGGTLPRLDPGVLAAIATAAHRNGLALHVHVGTCADAETALACGTDVIEHVPDPEGHPDRWEAVGDTLCRQRAAICPTLVAHRHMWDGPTLEAAARWVGRLSAAGVRVHAGTDTGNWDMGPGMALHDELDLLRRGGMTAGQVLAAATAHPRSSLPGASGRIARWCPADWLLVAGDPLTDLDALRKPAVVVRVGRVVHQGAGEGGGR